MAVWLRWWTALLGDSRGTWEANRAISASGSPQIVDITDRADDEVPGPFALQDAAQAYRFEADVTARSLRLDVVESSGGNTGLVEFATFDTPVAD